MTTTPTWPPSPAGPPQFLKSRQVNVRLTPGQEAALKRFCVQNDLTTQAAIIGALVAAVDGFEA